MSRKYPSLRDAPSAVARSERFAYPRSDEERERVGRVLQDWFLAEERALVEYEMNGTPPPPDSALAIFLTGVESPHADP